MRPVTLLGIDPGFAKFGMAIAEVTRYRITYKKIEVVSTEPGGRARLKRDDDAERLRFVAGCLIGMVDTWKPALICVEQMALPMGKLQMAVAVKLGRARGLIDAIAEKYGLEVLEETPIALKKAITGKPKAEKLEVQRALERTNPELLGLWPTLMGLHEHAADAAGIIRTCAKSEQVHHLVVAAEAS